MKGLGGITEWLNIMDNQFTTWYNNKYLLYFFIGLIAFFIVIVVWN